MKYWLVMKGCHSHVAIVYNENNHRWWELPADFKEDFRNKDCFEDAFEGLEDWERYTLGEESFSLKDMFPKCYVVEYEGYDSLWKDFFQYLDM